MIELQPVNTQLKDGDPRKFLFLRKLLKPHQEVLGMWHRFELMERKTEGKALRKHNASEHMLGGAANIDTIGKTLEGLGELTPQDTNEMVRAYLVHDCGKELERRGFIESAMKNEGWGSFRSLDVRQYSKNQIMFFLVKLIENGAELGNRQRKYR